MDPETKKKAVNSLNDYKSDNPEFDDWFFNHLKRMISREEAKKIWRTKYKYKIQESESDSLRKRRTRIEAIKQAAQPVLKPIKNMGFNDKVMFILMIIGIIVSILGLIL